jgi:hypothetical protein
MRNRAKCKLCNSIIESFTVLDKVECKCGEIAVSGGTVKYQTYARDYFNFLRVGDDDSEISVNLIDGKEMKEQPQKSKKEILSMLDEMIKSYENLPQSAMTSYVTHYDLLSALLLMGALFRSDCND